MIGRSAYGVSRSYACRGEAGVVEHAGPPRRSPASRPARCSTPAARPGPVPVSRSSMVRAWSCCPARAARLATVAWKPNSAGLRVGESAICSTVASISRVAALQPADRGEVGAEEAERVGVADLRCRARGRRRLGLGLVEPAGPDQQHHLDRLDDVEDAQAADGVRPARATRRAHGRPWRSPRWNRSTVRQHSPTRASMPVAGRGGDRDQLVGQRQPGLRVSRGRAARGGTARAPRPGPAAVAERRARRRAASTGSTGPPRYTSSAASRTDEAVAQRVLAGGQAGQRPPLQADHPFPLQPGAVLVDPDPAEAQRGPGEQHRIAARPWRRCAAPVEQRPRLGQPAAAQHRLGPLEQHRRARLAQAGRARATATASASRAAACS